METKNNTLILGLFHHKGDFTRSSLTSKSNMHFLCLNEDKDCYEGGVISIPKSMMKIEKVVEEKSINQVVALEDLSALLHAALVDKYPDRFRGPSLTSAFLAYNKYYTRQYLDPSPIKYYYIDPSQPQTKDNLEAAIAEVGLPAILKPSAGVGSCSIKKITSLLDLEEFIEEVRKSYQSGCDDCTEFVKKRLAGKDLVPQEGSEGFILEQYMDTPLKVSVDGYICNKKIVHWTIGDNCYWPTHPNCFQMTLIPTHLSEKVQKNIWNTFDQVCERLIHYGWESGFLNQEFFVLEDGTVKLMEVNARPTMAFCKAYCEVLENGNFIDTCMQINRGIRPQDPLLEGKSLAYVPMNCLVSGFFEDIADLEAVEATPNVSARKKQGDYIQAMGDSGIYLITGNLVGSSPDDVRKKHKDLYSRLFKIHPMGYIN